MSDTGAPERTPARQNGAAVLIGILVAGLVAGVFILKQTGGDAPLAPLAGPGITSSQPVRPAPTPPPANSTAPGERDFVGSDRTPGPLPENAEPPEEYEACVAWYESYGYNADNCPSPDPEWESMLAEASADPMRAPGLAINQPPENCRRHDLDEPGVFTCHGMGPPEPDSDGDSSAKTVNKFASAPLVIEGDFFSPQDQDAHGIQWPGGTMMVSSTEPHGHNFTITDASGRLLDEGILYAGKEAFRSELPAGNYVMFVFASAENPAVTAYRLDVRVG